MRSASLQAYLLRVTRSEQWHLDHPGEPSPVYATMPRTVVDGEEIYLFDWKNTLREHDVALQRESRFTTVPPHVNHDMALSYVYEGHCDYVVGGQELHLCTGDLVVFDPGVVRSSPTRKGERDLVVTMVFRKGFFDSVFLSRLEGGGIMGNMLFEYTARRRRHDRYLLLRAEAATNVRELMELIMFEHFFADDFSERLVRSHTASLFTEIARGLYYQGEQVAQGVEAADRLAPVLAHIEEHYKECTLTSVAERFGYNPSYLGTQLKERTGMTFGQIKLAQQMAEAAYLLLNTDRSIGSVAAKVGISNMSYFYRKFGERFHMSPRAYRQQMAAGGVPRAAAVGDFGQLGPRE